MIDIPIISEQVNYQVLISDTFHFLHAFNVRSRLIYN